MDVPHTAAQQKLFDAAQEVHENCAAAKLDPEAGGDAALSSATFLRAALDATRLWLYGLFDPFLTSSSPTSRNAWATAS